MGVGGGGATGSTGVELTTVLLGFFVKTLDDGGMFRGVTGESGGGWRTGVIVTFRLPLVKDSILLAMAGLKLLSGGD